MQSMPPIEDSKTNAMAAPEPTCKMRETDHQEGHINLCCCYIMDADGKFQDPCYHPADTCCP